MNTIITIQSTIQSASIACLAVSTFQISDLLNSAEVAMLPDFGMLLRRTDQLIETNNQAFLTANIWGS